MDRKLLLIGAAAAVVILGAAVALNSGDSSPSSGAAVSTSGAASPASGYTPTPVEGVDSDLAGQLREKGFLIGDVALGAEDAPVTIVEYLSTTCPHCADFHNETLPDLKEKYIETGKVRLIMREVYFNEPGLWSSLLARCAGPEQYHTFMDVLFAQQAMWTSGSESDIIANLRRIGRLGGLPSERIEACLNDGDFIKFMIDRYRAESNADGVRSTPHFLINGRTVTGNRSFSEFSQMIDAELGG